MNIRYILISCMFFASTACLFGMQEVKKSLPDTAYCGDQLDESYSYVRQGKAKELQDFLGAINMLGYYDVKGKVMSLIKCAAGCGQVDILKMLLEHANSMNTIDGLNEFSGDILSAMRFAAKYGRTDTLKVLLEYASNTNKMGVLFVSELVGFSSDSEKSPMRLAVENDHIEIMNCIMSLEHFSHSNYLMTLNHAAEVGSISIIDGLLASYDFDFSKEWGILCSACCGGNVQAIEYLLRYGFDSNLKNVCGATPLHEASSSGYLNVIELLLEHDAHINAQDRHGKTPLDVATTDAVKELLLQRGAKKGKDLISHNSQNKSMHDIFARYGK